MTKKDEYLEKEFNFEKAIKNPYAKELKRQVTININKSVIDYFKNESMHTGIPYQTLINLYLADCVKEKKKLKMNWEKSLFYLIVLVLNNETLLYFDLR